MKSKGIDIPKIRRPGAGRRPQKYGLDKLEIGGHIKVAGDADVIQSSVSTYARRTGKGFTTRRLEGGRVGIWRLK